ncbi:MAG: HAD-IC family P-type ATPase, partial [Methanomassiliicoccaceae archaeon]|nr:HAD-IC family P-type ATPase [Methanomassiliicoccaceae archaeon]
AAVRMSDSGILLQRSNSVESMSHVDTVCMDKTGTITTNKLVFRDITPFIDGGTAERYVRMFASSTGSRNRTIDALITKYGEIETETVDEIMFSSERKYAGVRLNDGGNGITLILGAYSVLSKNMGSHENIKDVVDGYSSEGLRTVVLVKGEGGFFVNDEAVLPKTLEPVAVIAIEDEVRPDCKSTIDNFIDNGIEIRILSGDDPAAVDALFKIAGIPGERKILSGDELDALKGDERKERIIETNIFGRMRPDQKQTVVEELKNSGRYVAMVGDGVNDVRSLKEANVGIALQSGSGAARGVADMVLVGDNFSALPKALVEGNRTVSGMRDILKMYLARNFVLAMLVFFITIIFNAPPLVPITSAIYAFVGLSIAAFFMAIWAQPSKIERTVLPDVLKYAIPAAIIISAFGFLLYAALHLGYTNGWLEWAGIQIPGNIESFGWGAYPSDPAGQLTYEAEVVARNALLVFLMLTGILQILFVVPRFGFFSVNGNIVKDAKPTVLMILLLGLLVLIYWAVGEYGASTQLSGKTAAEFFEVFLLPDGLYLIVGVFTAAWFFTARLILRRGYLGEYRRFAGWLYQRELRNAQKKRERRDQ